MRYNLNHHRFVKSVTGIGLIGCSHLAFAQPSPTSGLDAQSQSQAATAVPEADTQSGDIIVTAQRRAQSLQKVPISITALSNETIKEANLTDTLSFSRLAPNTTVRVFGSAPNIFIRGIGLNDFNASSVPPVAVYRDEVVLVAAAAQVYPLFDLERVEVLKGPQGTLFGRNTTGGAVSLVSHRPVDKLEAYLTASIGSYNERAFEGAINIPITPTFRVRLSGSSRQTNGDKKNAFDGRHAHYVDMQAIRAIATFEPNTDFKATLFAYGGRNRSDQNAPKPLGLLIGGKDALGYTDPFPNDSNKLNFNATTGLDSWDLGLTSVVEYRFGEVRLRSITGYDSSKADVVADTDGSPFTLNQPNYISRTKVFTQEFNLSGNSAGLVWVAGLFFLSDDLKYSTNSHFLGELAPIGRDLPLLTDAARDTKSYAAYAQGTYSLTDNVRLTGGLRYTHDELDSQVRTSLVYGYFDPAVPDAAPIYLIPARRVTQNFGRFSYRLAMEYDVAEKVLGYASVNHSFKQGGIYLTPTSSPSEADPFGPEGNTSYEVGLKSTLGNGLLRLNFAAFYNDYSDMQVVALVPSALLAGLRIQNAAKASIYGLEADFTLTPGLGLRFDGGIGWLYARFDSYPNATKAPITGAPIDYSGNPLPGAPDWTGNIAATYDWRLTNGWNGSVRVDYNYVAKRYFNGAKNPLVSDEAYGLLGARISVRTPGEGAEFSLWGRNLTNSVYLENASDLSSLGFIPRYYGARRSIGGSLSLKF